MSDEHGEDICEPDDMNIGLIATVLVVGAFLVVSISAALVALLRAETDRFSDAQGAYADLGGVARLRADQQAKLVAPPAWADKAKGLVSIPLDRATSLVTADLKSNPALATPVKPEEEEPDEPDGGAGDGGAAEEQAEPADDEKGEAAGEEEPKKAPAPAPKKKDAPAPAPEKKAPAPAPEKKAPAPEAPTPAAPAPAPPAPEAPEE